MPRSVKVLHVLHAFMHGGLENGVVNIINGSPPEIEHALCVLTQGDEFLQRIRRPVRCWELHKSAGNSGAIIVKLARAIRQSGVDIVHTRNWGAFDGVLAACLCPRVKLLHGEHGRDISDPHGLNRRRNSIRRLLSFRVAKFTTVSQELSRWLIHTVHIAAEKVAVIANGVDVHRYRPHRDETLRDELGIAPDDFVIGTIGRLDPVKNHAGLIRAFSLIPQTASRARLVIAGEGPERANLENLIRNLSGVPPPILTGYRADVERLYGIFDVFVLNSFAEGMSNTLLEAMASGLPIVCTAVGAATELITDGKQGVHVPPAANGKLASALNTYQNSPQLRARHGAEGRLHVEKHCSLESMIECYLRIYKDACGR
jgi:sugar transferase (PEP-CTERM/EpsH1 system associated)